MRTPALVGFAPAHPNGFTLAYAAVAGHSLDREPDGPGFDAMVGEVWGQVAILRRSRIAHRDLRLANVFVGDDGAVWLIDFGFSELAADDVLLDGDVAELLASTASVVGPERAVAAAVPVVGPEAVAIVRRPPASGAAERGHPHLARGSAGGARPPAGARRRRLTGLHAIVHGVNVSCSVCNDHAAQRTGQTCPAWEMRAPSGAR